MKQDLLKNFTAMFSDKTISRIIILVTPIILGSGYGLVTFYNKMVDTIEATESLGGMKADIHELKIQVESLKERQMESLNASIRIQEKSSDAYVLAKESNAVALSTQRELKASTAATKSEVETMIRSVEDKLDIIKRSVTNPLDRR